jgi:hypothetical protein
LPYGIALHNGIERGEKKKRWRQEKEKEPRLDLFQMIIANKAERLAKLMQDFEQWAESIQ